jgi:hypothetical protein
MENVALHAIRIRNRVKREVAARGAGLDEHVAHVKLPCKNQRFMAVAHHFLQR